MSGRRSSDGYMPFFSAPPVNSGIIDAIYKLTDPEFRRNALKTAKIININ